MEGLVTQSLEHISCEVFSKYASLITQLVEKSSGVYALYDEGDLRAIQLRRRVKQHLTDKHDSSWTHFTIYLIGNNEHIGEIESLLARIPNPKGTSVKPRGRDSREMHKKLEMLIKQKHREKLVGLLSKKKPALRKISGAKKSPKGLVNERNPHRSLPQRKRQSNPISLKNNPIQRQEIHRGSQGGNKLGFGKCIALLEY